MDLTINNKPQKLIITGNRESLLKILLIGAIILVNLILWLIPSNVVYLVAQQRDVLLGRYSLDRFTVLIILLPISLAMIQTIRSSKKPTQKQKFRLMAVSISIVLSILVIDGLGHFLKPKHYVTQNMITHRIPNTRLNGMTHDVPRTDYSYPNATVGYPDIAYTITVDKRGFRNLTDLSTYDIITLGDSFTEGSGVSDEDAWPILLGSQSGLNVCNLGVSGSHPGNYVEILNHFGLPLKPDIAICMLFEGNDFRSSNYKQKKKVFGYVITKYIKTSFVRRLFKNLLLRTFGPIGSPPDRIPKPGDTLYPIAWQPLSVPGGETGKRYTFKIKKLRDHYKEQGVFENSLGCQSSFNALRDLKQICQEHHIRLIVVYAPDKPHVLLPLVRDQLVPQQLHAFMELKIHNLPPPDKLIETVMKKLEVEETAFRIFCRKESIEFISLTRILRKKILAGQQVYFTYDIHWTPLGHVIAADVLSGYLQNTAKIK